MDNMTYEPTKAQKMYYMSRASALISILSEMGVSELEIRRITVHACQSYLRKETGDVLTFMTFDAHCELEDAMDREFALRNYAR